jgi:DNA-binding transcriptional MerR regulator
MKNGMSIGELARRTGTKVVTIRFYEREGILPEPARTEVGYRHYSENDAERLAFVRRARELGFPLEAVCDLLDLADDKKRSCSEVDRIARSHLEDVERKLAG